LNGFKELEKMEERIEAKLILSIPLNGFIFMNILSSQCLMILSIPLNGF